jgi:hypothetical protein
VGSKSAPCLELLVGGREGGKVGCDVRSDEKKRGCDTASAEYLRLRTVMVLFYTSKFT